MREYDRDSRVAIRAELNSDSAIDDIDSQVEVLTHRKGKTSRLPLPVRIDRSLIPTSSRGLNPEIVVGGGHYQ